MRLRRFLGLLGAGIACATPGVLPAAEDQTAATMNPPAAYRHWQNQARRLLEPLAALMQPGKADLPIAGPASDHDRQADRLESFARPLLLAAFWLQSALLPEDAELRQRVARWFREGLVAGSDPANPQYWGPDASYHQHHVEMGLLAIALQLAPADLWDPLPAAAQDQVARWFATCRGGGIVNNNHLFMSVHILEFLKKIGREHRTDAAVIEAHLNQLETMHRGDGWFEDGINQAYDHYNAYAFHFYGLMWARLHGQRHPARAQRWRDWARLFVGDYQHFFAANGEPPAFGRSITYRFNAINVFGLAAAEGCTDVPLGRLRRLCTRHLDFFLARPIYQEQGCLSCGFTDRWDKIAEPYTCAGSPYWAAKGFTPLLLPPTHAFWRAPEEPLPAERGDFVRVMPVPGLIVRGVQGDVEILNGGSMVSNTQLRYGAWKWSKTAYRTGTHFTFAFPEITNVSVDSALTQRLDDGRRFGRHSTVAVELDEQHLGYAYNLGFKTGQVNTGVETFVWWRAGWLLQVHHVTARQPAVLCVGGYALPLAGDERSTLTTAPMRTDDGRTVLASFAGPRGTVLQALHGITSYEWDRRLDDASERRHVAAPYHLTPLALTERLTGEGGAGTMRSLVVLTWTGRNRAEAQPWRVTRGTAGAWRLEHPLLGSWELKHWALPEIASAQASPR